MRRSQTLALTLALVPLPLLSASAGQTVGEVDQKGLRFAKAEIAISVGGTVRFLNSDDVTHNIMTIDENDEPEDRGLQKPGQAISTKFEKAGSYQVRCSIHPKMKMTVKVGK